MVILFDGICNLCNGFVLFVIKRDKKNLFKFASLQSKYGTALLEHFNLKTEGFDTILLYDGKHVYTRSDAVIRILSKLIGIWKAFIVFMIIPAFIRNFFYSFVARRRYKLFGKREACMVPTPELATKFTDEQPFS